MLPFVQSLLIILLNLLLLIVDDELVKVVRVGKISLELEEDETMRDDDLSFAGLNEEFTSQILSGVRFAPLVHVSGSTVIPANVWKPSIQRGYPSEFKHASMQLLMCSNSQLIQPLPQVPSQDERCNIAAMLPQSIWFNILSYTHRKWFEPEQSETDYLKRRLREEKAKVANAEKARRDAEERCREAEKERVSVCVSAVLNTQVSDHLFCTFNGYRLSTDCWHEGGNLVWTLYLVNKRSKRMRIRNSKMLQLPICSILQVVLASIIYQDSQI